MPSWHGRIMLDRRQKRPRRRQAEAAERAGMEVFNLQTRKGKIEARRYTFALESLALRMGHGLPVLYRAFWSWQEITRKQTRSRLCSDPLPAIFAQVSLPLLVSESNGSKMPSESRIQSPETLAQDVGGISSAQMDGCY